MPSGTVSWKNSVFVRENFVCSFHCYASGEGYFRHFLQSGSVHDDAFACLGQGVRYACDGWRTGTDGKGVSELCSVFQQLNGVSHFLGCFCGRYILAYAHQDGGVGHVYRVEVAVVAVDIHSFQSAEPAALYADELPQAGKFHGAVGDARSGVFQINGADAHFGAVAVVVIIARTER